MTTSYLSFRKSQSQPGCEGGRRWAGQDWQSGAGSVISAAAHHLASARGRRGSATKLRIGYRYSTGKKTPGGAGTVPVKRHRGEPGHTRDTRDTRAHAVQYRNNGDRNVRGGTVPPAAGRRISLEPFPAHEHAHEVPTDPRARAPHERQRACAASSTKISPATHKALGRVRVVLAPGRRRELRPQGQLGG